MNPKTIIYLLIARSHIALENFTESIETLKQIDETNNDYIYLKHFLLGYCYQKLDLFEQAEREYKKVVDLNTTFADVYYNLGMLYKSLNNSILSKRNLQICLKLNKSHPLALVALKQLDKGWNWFSWWFEDGEKIHKKALGLVLLGSFFATMYGILLFNNDNVNLTIILGIIILILILPNIKSISHGDNKLEIHPFLNYAEGIMWDPYISSDFEKLEEMFEAVFTSQDSDPDGRLELKNEK